jgi:hypothetical protein
VARKFDPDAVPSGWNLDVWDVALFFEAVGEGYGHVSNGRPIIYTYLEKQVTRKGWLEDVAKNQPSVHDPQLKKWVWMLREMIQHWWDYEMDVSRAGSAVNEFCSPVTFDRVLYRIQERISNHLATEEFDKLRRGEESKAYRIRLEPLPPEERAAKMAKHPWKNRGRQ